MFDYELLEIIPSKIEGANAKLHDVGRLQTDHPLTIGAFITKKNVTYVVSGTLFRTETGKCQLLLQQTVKLNFDLPNEKKIKKLS